MQTDADNGVLELMERPHLCSVQEFQSVCKFLASFEGVDSSRASVRGARLIVFIAFNSGRDLEDSLDFLNDRLPTKQWRDVERGIEFLFKVGLSFPRWGWSRNG